MAYGAPDDDEIDFTDMPTARAPDMALIFHDDAETPTDFVMFLLERYCGLAEEHARAILHEISARGKAVAAVFPERIAQIKLSQIESAARNRYPFRVSLESTEP